MPYDRLALEAANIPVDVHERKMVRSIKGLYGDGTIWINRDIPTRAEKSCILAEEIGHHHTSSGSILDQRDVRNKKQEKRARNWAYEKLVPLEGIIAAYKAGVRNRFELAEHLGVIEDFLDSAIRHYQEKYEFYAVYDRYVIGFDPLYVAESFEKTE